MVGAAGLRPRTVVGGLWLWGLGATSVPLPPIFAASAPGCALLSTADVTNLIVAPIGGTLTVQQAVPAVPALVGLAVYHQVGQVEFDPSTLAMTRISASGGLQLTVGSL